MFKRAHITALIIGSGLMALLACSTSSSRPPQSTRKVEARGAAQVARSGKRKAQPVPAETQALTVYQRAEALARYAAGISHELNQRSDLALQEFHKAALADPSQDMIVMEVLRRYMQAKQTDKAIEFLDQIGQTPGAPSYLHAWKGLVYGQAGQTDKAVEANRAAITAMPRAMAGYQNLFNLYLQNKTLPLARQVLEEASAVKGTDVGFSIELVDLFSIYLRQVPADEAALKPIALKLLQKAESAKPASPLQQIKLADGFQLMGQTQKALALYEDLIATYPDFPTLREKLALLYWREKDYAKASENLEKIIKNNPTNPEIYFDLGGLSFEQKKFKEAAEYYRKALILNPGLEQAYYDLAACYLNENLPQDALRYLDMAVQRFPKTFLSEYLRALCHNRMKDYKTAVFHFTESEVLARTNDPAKITHFFYFEVGATCERNRDFEQAEKYFLKCLEMQPDFAEGLNYLGYMWAEQGTNLERARDFIEKAVKLEPKNAAYLDSLGWVFYKLKQPDKALPFLEDAVKHAEEPDPTLFDHLGDVYQALKKSKLAREAWQKSIAIEPNEAISRKLKDAPLN